jgi:hypothetical protein
MLIGKKLTKIWGRRYDYDYDESPEEMEKKLATHGAAI